MLCKEPQKLFHFFLTIIGLCVCAKTAGGTRFFGGGRLLSGRKKVNTDFAAVKRFQSKAYGEKFSFVLSFYHTQKRRGKFRFSGIRTFLCTLNTAA